jgi:hypothetical protein
MVQIGGLELKMPSLGLGGLGSVVTVLFWTFMIFVTVGLIGWWIYSSYRNKAIFTNPITLTFYYDNGTKRTKTGLKGGKFVNRGGVWHFKVKIPKQFKKKELGYTPDFSKADADGTIHFITSGDGTLWQQIEHRLVTTDDMGFALLMKPIPTDIKTVTVNSIKSWS